MIGTYQTVSVTGTYASRRDAEPTQYIGLAHLSKYNALVNEGAAFGRDYPYPFRYLFDTDDAVTVRVFLSQPARGYETFTLIDTLPDNFDAPGVVYTDEGYFEAQVDVDYTRNAGFTYAFKPGERFKDIRITPVERPQWFVERLLHLRLEQSNVQGAQVLPYATVNLISIASHRTPPVLTVSGPGSGTGTFDITFSLDAACIDPVTIYYNWVDNATGLPATDVTPTNASGASGVATIPAGGTSLVVNFTESTTVGQVRKITVDHERGTVVLGKQQAWIDSEAGTYTVTRDIHIDENLVRRSNDIFRHGMTGRNTKTSYTAEQGIRPHVGGFPSMSLVDGAGEINHLLLGEGQFDTVLPDNTVNDPITGRAMYYMVPSSNANGMPYVRQEFPPAYGGGPISAFPLQQWSRVAYRREFFYGSEASKNTEYARVGYRIRVRDRNTGVVFKFRKTGTDPWGDAGVGSYTFRFNGTVAGSLEIDIYDVDGVYRRYKWGGTTGGTTVGVVVPATITSETIAAAWADAFNGSHGQKLTALHSGDDVTLSHTEAAPVYDGTGVLTNRWSDKPITYNTSAWFKGSPASPQRFTTPTIVDGAGRDMRPASVGGTNEQYYYDSVSGVEVWFWHRYNQWRQRVGYSGTVSPNSDDAWGQWYGVTRDDAGLCLWYIQYMPLETAVNEHYRYGTVGMDGRDSAALVNSGNKGLWNYDEVTSETLGNKILDDGSAYYDQRGWNFAGDIGNPIEYPTWIAAGTNKPDPFPAGGGLYQDGSREGTNTLNHVRDNRRGCLWHSWWFETQDAQFAPMGPPTDYWPCFGNYWTPRGYAITTDPRSNHVVIITA